MSEQLAALAQESQRPPEVPRIYLAQQIPGFGGYYWEDGNLVVVLTDPAHAATARAASRAYLQAVPEKLTGQQVTGVPEIIVRVGNYEFMVLREWRDRMTGPVLAVDGVVFTSLNYAENRLHIGVENFGVRTQVERVLSGLSIPLAAVIFQETKLELDMTLREHQRPLRGGFLLARPWDSPGIGCTMSFVAGWDSRIVLLTASHCSETYWGTDYTDFYQPSTSDGSYYVGYESYDPAAPLVRVPIVQALPLE